MSIAAKGQIPIGFGTMQSTGDFDKNNLKSEGRQKSDYSELKSEEEREIEIF